MPTQQIMHFSISEGRQVFLSVLKYLIKEIHADQSGLQIQPLATCSSVSSQSCNRTYSQP